MSVPALIAAIHGFEMAGQKLPYVQAFAADANRTGSGLSGAGNQNDQADIRPIALVDLARSPISTGRAKVRSPRNRDAPPDRNNRRRPVKTLCNTSHNLVLDLI